MSPRQESKLRAEYATRLMAALGFATQRRWGLSVRDGWFVVQAEQEYCLAHSWSREVDICELVELEREVDREIAADAEHARVQALRYSARAKLTDEEANAVGLHFGKAVSNDV